MSTVPLESAETEPSYHAGSLVLVNAFTIAMALAFSWPLHTLLLPYWIQSLLIGYFAQRRIRALHEFSTDNFEVDGHSVEPTEATKRETANFFILHYGIFHLVYFLIIASGFKTLAWYDWLAILPAAVSFYFNHRASFRRNVQADIRGRPNIGALMFLPYARILPMHLTVILGGATHFTGAFPLLLFGTLKTFADVLMHNVEHRMLQKEESAEGG